MPLASSGVDRTLIFTVFVLCCLVVDESRGTGAGVPCTYEGHLKTEKNWFGYLANVSIITTGRMTFQFSYQADRCCQNILFYSKDQVTIINARMNCWQKEYLLRPEEDQILRLTPRFSWSGCHVTHPNGIPTYVCEGGRSFTVDQQAVNGPTSWYIAVSNCATLQGLDLQYRLVIYGHVGDCRSAGEASSFGSSLSLGSPAENPRFLLMQKSPNPPMAYSDSSCVLEGRLNTSSNWYGFLANISLARGGGMHFQFTYPAVRRVQNILLYNETDVRKLKLEKTCWQKVGIIQPPNSQEKLLELSFQSSWNGCVSKEGTTPSDLQVICQGERWYDEPRKIFMAVSNCFSHNGLILHYRLEIFGFTNEICSGGAELMTKSHWIDRLLSLTIVTAVLTSLQNPGSTFALW